MNQEQSDTSIIRLENLAFKADAPWKLEQLNLSFSEKLCTVILGPSGSGKSLILKLAAGLYLPQSGRVLFQGQNINSFSESENSQFRKKTGFVFQDSALWANKSVYQNLELPLRFHEPSLPPTSIKQRIESTLVSLGYDEDPGNRPHQISSGDQKRVSLGRAMVTNPQLIFLDDPTANLDGSGIEELIKVLETLKARGTTLIMVNQYAPLTARLADSLVVISEGRVLDEGNFDQVTRSENPKVIEILTDVLSQSSTYSHDILDLLGGDS